MTRRFRPLLLLLLTAGATVAVAAPDPVPADSVADSVAVRRAPRVPWLTDRSWTSLLGEARAAGQPILIDFTATWCGPCKLLDVMVFTEKSVIDQLAEVVTVKVDIDRPGTDDLPRRFRIAVVPTLVWCDAYGNEQDRFTGYVSNVEFLATLATWRRGLTLDQTLSARLATAPDAPEVLLDLARRQAQCGNLQAAEVAYRRLMNLRHSADPIVVARGMLGLAEMEQAAGRPARVRELTERASEVFRQRAASGVDLPRLVPGLMEVADFQRALGDTSGALVTWGKLMEVDARNPAVLEGFARAALAADQRLEDATRAALRAMVYSDNDAAVIGVLAECYHRRGLNDRALRWIDESIARDPEETRFREQRRRYLAAISRR